MKKRTLLFVLVALAVAVGATADSYRYPDVRPSGSLLVVSSSVTSSGIANNAQTSPLTTAASGTLLLQDYIVTCDGTGWAAPTNIEISLDDTVGAYQDAATPIDTQLIALFAADTTFSFSAESGAIDNIARVNDGVKVYIHGDDAAGTGAGVCTVDLVFVRVTEGATISAVNVP